MIYSWRSPLAGPGNRRCLPIPGARSGRVVWENQWAADLVTTPLVGPHGQIVVGLADASVACLSSDGQPLWYRALELDYRAPFFGVIDREVVILLGHSDLYYLELGRGQLQWSIPLPARMRRMVWNWPTGIISETNQLYLFLQGDGCPDLYRVDRQSGELSTASSARVYSRGLAAVGGMIYAGSVANGQPLFLAISTESGDATYVGRQLGRTPYYLPLATENHLFLSSYNSSVDPGRIRCLSRTLEPAWDLQAAASPCCLLGCSPRGNLWALDTDGRPTLYAAESGSVLRQLEFPARQIAVDDEGVVFASGDSKFAAIEPNGKQLFDLADVQGQPVLGARQTLLLRSGRNTLLAIA